MKTRQQPRLHVVPIVPVISAATTRTAVARPELRGFHVVFRSGETNRCPGCGRSHWYVGRTTAECAFCETALPISEDGSRATEPGWNA